MPAPQEAQYDKESSSTEKTLIQTRDNLRDSFTRLDYGTHEKGYVKDAAGNLVLVSTPPHAQMYDEITHTSVEVFPSQENVSSLVLDQGKSKKPMIIFNYSELGVVGLTGLNYKKAIYLYDNGDVRLEIDTPYGGEILYVDFTNKTLDFDVVHPLTERSDGTRRFTFEEIDKLWKQSSPKSGQTKLFSPPEFVHYEYMIQQIEEADIVMGTMANEQNKKDRK